MGGFSINNPEVIQSFEKTDSYVLTEYDHKNVIYFNTDFEVTCFIPAGLRIGFTCTIVQRGYGKVRFSKVDDGSGAKINGADITSRTRGNWAWAKVLCIAANEYTVDFGGASDGTPPPTPFVDTDTTLINPHIVGTKLYFDLLNVVTNAVIPNYEFVELPQNTPTNARLVETAFDYTLTNDDDGAVIVFVPDRSISESLTLYIPEGLTNPAFACTVIPRRFLASQRLDFKPVDGANVQINNINGAFASNTLCQQILVQGIGSLNVGIEEYVLSFVEQTQTGGDNGGAAVPSLQEVTDVGDTTTNSIQSKANDGTDNFSSLNPNGIILQTNDSIDRIARGKLIQKSASNDGFYVYNHQLPARSGVLVKSVNGVLADNLGNVNTDIFYILEGFINFNGTLNPTLTILNNSYPFTPQIICSNGRGGELFNIGIVDENGDVQIFNSNTTLIKKEYENKPQSNTSLNINVCMYKGQDDVNFQLSNNLRSPEDEKPFLPDGIEICFEIKTLIPIPIPPDEVPPPPPEV